VVPVPKSNHRYAEWVKASSNWVTLKCTAFPFCKTDALTMGRQNTKVLVKRAKESLCTHHRAGKPIQQSAAEYNVRKKTYNCVETY
jgi:hypothetical protein